MVEERKSSFPAEAQAMLEQNAYRYHLVGCWVGLVLNPLFAITDFYIFPEHWFSLLTIRLLVSLIVLCVVLVRDKIEINASVLISIPLLLIALQNAYVYSFAGAKDLLGQNLNFMALLIGAGMFVLWRWTYSFLVLIISAGATAGFIYLNPDVSVDIFFVHGGLLLIATGIFMLLLIQTRYNLTRKTITAELALKNSKKLLEVQSEEIQHINENLELIVKERTRELERKNKALEEYAFINSHKLRAPVASILGLLGLLSNEKATPEVKEIVEHLKTSTTEMDAIVRDITKAIEEGE